ncbi:MAG: AAA family ATPase [Candidatus Izemoplasmatales bacterium]
MPYEHDRKPQYHQGIWYGRILSGKSTLLCSIFADYLMKQGIPKERIIIVNLESIDNEPLRHYKRLYDHIVERLDPNHKNYVMIDEVQNAFEFQKAGDSLYLMNNVDLYITGSNSYMLSGELASLLSGRYVTIEMLPLSFLEYLESTKANQNINVEFRNHL